VAVLGLQINVGLAGQINLGQSAFVGVGAFVVAMLAGRGYGFWICIPAAALVTAAVSILFSLPAIRIRGLYLALTTIAAQIMFPIIVIRLPSDWFGGTSGLPVDPPSLFGVRAGTPSMQYAIAVVVAGLAFVAAMNLTRSRTGRAFRAIRDNDIASSVIGIDLARYKILAFVAGALFAGVSGGLYAYYVRYVSTDQFTLWLSVWYIGMLVVGGLHSPLGAVLGVAAMTAVEEGLHYLGSVVLASSPQFSGGTIFPVANMVLGAFIILILLFEPKGLVHRWSLLKLAYRLWPYARK